MIVFDIARVERWAADRSRYQGGEKEALVQVCQKESLLSELWFSICKIYIMPALTASQEKKRKIINF